MSEQKKNVLQRINQVRKAIGYVQKDKSVSAGAGGSYKAVTHDQVTALVRGPMIEAGIICIPNLLSSCANAREINDKGETSKQFRYDATYEFVFASEDDIKDCVTIKIEAHAMDNSDKAPGKALSYAKKYAMLKLFELETGEDDESRYQTEEFDLAQHIDLINACDSMDDLKKQFSSSFRSAEEARDKDAQKSIITAKENAKKRISEAAK